MANVLPQVISRVGQVSRVPRRPQHTFQLAASPFVIQPFLCAPVLPGETLKNLQLQARVVTDPIKNPLVGWWQEYYIFYVKHRDLDERDTLVDMMLDASTSLAAIDQTVAQRHTYHGGGASGREVHWVNLCLKRVVKCYFRDEDENWDTHQIEAVDGTAVNMPIAKINKESWFDTLLDVGALDDTTVVNEGGAAAHSAGDLERSRQTWEFLVTNQMTKMTYEDYLATYGVRPSTVELHKPELIRYLRDWTYPTNTVNSSTGAVVSACSWSIAERADKDRFFTEPGFIFGITITRPKVYAKNQIGAGVQLLNHPFCWLPAVLADEPATSLRLIDNASGPLGGITNDYWVDVRDLYIHGDQFHNLNTANTDKNLVALPTAALETEYVTEADIDGLFVTAGTARYVRQDGVVTLTILGTQQDHT